MSEAVDKLLAFAASTLGMSDQNNTVRTPVHTWYNAKFGNPDTGKYAWDWCDGWVTYIAWQTGNQDAVVFGGGYAYTVDHAKKFKAKGQWHTDVAGIQPGDVVFFDWDGSNDIDEIDHVGIVESVAGSKVNTIEGNIENAVRRKVRDASTIVGYGRPSYAGGSTPPAGGGTVATVKLADAQAHKAGATKIIQDALNREFGGVAVDGDFGPQTTAAYLRWQQSLGWPGDGKPSPHSLWSLAKKYGFTTDITGTPAGPPTSTPPEEPSVSSVTYEDLGPGGVKAANLVIQKLLAAHWGLDYSSGPGVWGSLTMAAYSRFQHSLGFTGSPAQPGSDADGRPGVTSMTRFCAKYGVELKRRAPGTTAPTPPATTTPKPTNPEAATLGNYLNAPEPKADYTRTTYGGKTVNRRTAALLSRAAGWAGVTITLTQGSYNSSVSASAGTHDGGGAVDIAVGSWSSSRRVAVVDALRKAGFAAWLRTPAEGFAYHIHAVAIGDTQASSGAKNQVQSYFNGRNGLANNRASTGATHWPNWADKYNH